MPTAEDAVLCCGQWSAGHLTKVLSPYRLQLQWVGANTAIPGSHWGDPEAGLIGRTLFVRPDTPVHSALHEASHYVCMDERRRHRLDTDAGGDYAEENAVCYLQILLADEFPEVGRERMMTDMDTWGYSFRFGSAARWFYHDAGDARQWLQGHGVIGADGRPSWLLRH